MTRSRDTASIIPTVDAKGDLLVGTADNTVDNLSPGTNGQLLTANSATATGLEWKTVSATAPVTYNSTTQEVGFDQSRLGGTTNVIINGAFDIWQRGTSFTGASGANGTFQADRFNAENNSTTGLTISRQEFTPGAAPVAGYEGSFFLRYAVSTASSVQGINQKIEDVRSFAGQTATLSFWAKAASNTTVTAIISRVFGSGGSSPVDVGDTSFSVTTSWQRFSFTLAIPSIAGKTIGTSSFLNVRLLNLTNSTFILDFWGVQLEAGTVATPFKRNAPSIQAELAACQRYYWRDGGITSIRLVSGHQLSATSSVAYLSLPVTMRIAPYSVGFSSLLWTDGITADVGASAVILYLPGSRSFIGFQITHSSIGVAAKPGNLISGGTGSFLELNAEL